MSHAIANLVDNAIKYSGNHSQINVEMEHTPNEVVIRIRDQGIGIASDELERVQERFYRAKMQAQRTVQVLDFRFARRL